MNTPWPPKKIPNSLAAFTPYKGGWIRRYNGKPHHVCGRTTPIDQVENCWIILKKKLDADGSGPPAPAISVTLKELASDYVVWLERRVKKGKPNPLATRTFLDYVKAMDRLVKTWGSDRDMLTLGPADFDRLARKYDKGSPGSLTRAVAEVHAFFQWAKGAHLIPEVPDFGNDFVKPAVTLQRDQRITFIKSFTPEEIQKLWKAATGEEKLFIALGINCAFDNSDISELTYEVVDLENGIIDYRRRKVGKVRRIIPLHPRTLRLLKAYRTHPFADEQYKNHVFLRGDGRPLVHIQPSRKDPSRLAKSDELAMKFTRLLSRAGIRGKIINKWNKVTQKTSTTYPKGDGRGFRSFRTTFPNFAPQGYLGEIELVMGHAKGTVLKDNYLEDVALDRVAELIQAVWTRAFTKQKPQGEVSLKRFAAFAA